MSVRTYMHHSFCVRMLTRLIGVCRGAGNAAIRRCSTLYPPRRQPTPPSIALLEHCAPLACTPAQFISRTFVALMSISPALVYSISPALVYSISPAVRHAHLVHIAPLPVVPISPISLSVISVPYLARPYPTSCLYATVNPPICSLPVNICDSDCISDMRCFASVYLLPADVLPGLRSSVKCPPLWRFGMFDRLTLLCANLRRPATSDIQYNLGNC